MRAVACYLEAWRQAELRRDALPFPSPAWRAANSDVRRARADYQRAVRDAAAYHGHAEGEVPGRAGVGSERPDQLAVRGE